MIGPRLPWNVGVGLVAGHNTVKHPLVLALFVIPRNVVTLQVQTTSLSKLNGKVENK